MDDFFGLLWSVKLSWHLWVCHLAYENVLHGLYNEAWASLVAQMVKHLPAMQETRVQSLGWEDPLKKEMATHSSILAWRIPRTEEPGGLCFAAATAAKLLQSCPTLCDPMDCSLPGFSVHEIFQAKVLEWVAISFSRGSSQPRD